MGTRTEEDRIVHVSPKGQATIPKRLCEKYDIDTSGRVRFRETEEGIVVEPVSNLADLRGVLASDRFERGEVTARLREMREDEREQEDREDAQLEHQYEDD